MRALFRVITTIILLLSITFNIYIYQFDRISGCKWQDEQAEIKILAFGDPQITGSKDASLRKKLDVYGNDHFLGHIYNVLKDHLKPTHIAVMGDLISSQWIDDDEFYNRGERFKNRIFKQNDNLSPIFVNISGNHDIGYNGEMNFERVTRFEKVYGKLNYIVESNNHWRFIVINSLSLDGPGYDDSFHQDTLNLIDEINSSHYQGATILFSHVPLYKKDPICKDSTFFNYYSWGTLREQNHLSKESSDLLLNSIFKPDNPYGGLILTGHDHEGCITDYHYDSINNEWLSSKPSNPLNPSNPSIIREITVRSMMGEYGGNGGLITGIYNPITTSWNFSYSLCSLGVQHIWWITKVLTYLSLTLTPIYLIVAYIN